MKNFTRYLSRDAKLEKSEIQSLSSVSSCPKFDLFVQKLLVVWCGSFYFEIDSLVILSFIYSFFIYFFFGLADKIEIHCQPGGRRSWYDHRVISYTANFFISIILAIFLRPFFRRETEKVFFLLLFSVIYLMESSKLCIEIQRCNNCIESKTENNFLHECKCNTSVFCIEYICIGRVGYILVYMDATKRWLKYFPINFQHQRSLHCWLRVYRCIPHFKAKQDERIRTTEASKQKKNSPQIDDCYCFLYIFFPIIFAEKKMMKCISFIRSLSLSLSPALVCHVMAKDKIHHVVYAIDSSALLASLSCFPYNTFDSVSHAAQYRFV